MASAGDARPALIDTKAYGRLRSFSGKEEEWATWSFVARSYLALLSTEYQEYLSKAEAAEVEHLALSQQGDQARSHSWTFFNVLVQSVEGRALSVLMNVEAGNGLLAWRTLVDTYEPRIGGRWTSMLMGIIGPQRSSVTEESFLQTLEAWEVMIRRYEEQSGEEVTGATRCAVVMRHAPAGIRTALRTASSSIGTNFELLRKCVKDYLQTGQAYDAKGQANRDLTGPTPMEVGSLQFKGKYEVKGKGPGKYTYKGGKKGKELSKGKDGGKKGSFSKGKFDKPKGFEGYCSYCSKWGHKKAECRQRERDRAAKGKGGSVNATTAEENTPGGSASVAGAVSYICATSAEEVAEADETEAAGEEVSWQRSPSASPEPEHIREVQTMEIRSVPKRPRLESEGQAGARAHEARWQDHGSESESDSLDRWVAAIEGRPRSRDVGGENFIMYDTGSDEHVCTEAFARASGPLRPSHLNLRAVSGEPLSIMGEAVLTLTLLGKAGRAVQVEVTFQVSRNATKNILSGGKLYKAGFLAVIKPGAESCLWHEHSETEIPLHLQGSTFYLKMVRGANPRLESRDAGQIVAQVAGGDSAELWENAGDDHPIEDQVEPGEDLPDVRGAGYGVPVHFDASSTVREIKDRLRELGWSVWGTKAELLDGWKRAERERARLEKKRLEARDDQDRRNEDEMRPARMLPLPGQPTEAEVARHNLTHMPKADWCEHCTKGKGKEKDHHRLEHDRAIIQLDYSYMKTDGSEGVEDAAEVILTAVDCSSGLTLAMSLPAKNFEMKYAQKTLKEFIGQLGHVTVAVRTDNEPTILKLVGGLRDELNESKLKGEVMKCHLESIPRYSSASLGHVGAKQNTLKGDVLTLRSQLEEWTGQVIHPGHTIWPWMVRHAAWTRNRYGVKANKRTAFEDAFGHTYSSPLVPFGEIGLFKMPASASGRSASKRQLKGDFSWEKGMFLGKTLSSDEFLIGTKQGIHTCRTVKRLVAEMRNPKEWINEVIGVPWIPGRVSEDHADQWWRCW